MLESAQIFCENSLLTALGRPLKNFRIVLLSLCGFALTGCSVFEDYWDTHPIPEESEVAIPPQEREQLEPINRSYFVLESAEQGVVGEPQIVIATDTDTFSDLAREYGLGYDEVVAANPGVDPWLPGEGTAVLLPTQYVLPGDTRSGVVLNIASKRLFYYPPTEEGEQQAVMTYPIGIGRVGWETPLGETTVVSKAKDPVWYVPASVRKEHEELGDPLPAIVQPGPDNPLGRHVLKLGLPGYLIHGTNQPYGVGMRVSHGCVRLYPENIELLYSLIPIGEEVRIVNEPYVAGELNGDWYFEAHAPLEDDDVLPEDRLTTLTASNELFQTDTAQLDFSNIAASAFGVPIVIGTEKPDDVMARARVVRNTVEVDPENPTLEEVRALMDEAQAEVETAEAMSEPDEESTPSPSSSAETAPASSPNTSR